MQHAVRSDTGSVHGSIVAFNDRVVVLSRNYSSYASTRIRIVTLPTRNEVNMSVHYRLTSNRATVDSYVETEHRRIFLKDEISGFGE